MWLIINDIVSRCGVVLLKQPVVAAMAIQAARGHNAANTVTACVAWRI